MGKRPVPKPFDEPSANVTRARLSENPSSLLESLKAMQVETLPVERLHEALDNPVTFRLTHVGGRNPNPKPRELIDPTIDNALRSLITAEPQTASDMIPKRQESVTRALTNRLQRRAPVAELHDMPAHELIEMMIDDPEEPPPAVLLGDKPDGVRAYSIQCPKDPV